MSLSSLGLTSSTLRTTLPFLTAALQTSSILSGLYFLLTPSEGAKLFGIPFKKADSPTPSELAFTRIHGVRDLALGVVGLRLVSVAYGFEVRGEMGAARAVGSAIGSLVLAGVAFAVGDGWVCGEVLAEEREGEKEGNSVLKHIVVVGPVALVGLAWFYV